ncbi:hypothetical protein UCRNP2_9084 [Neofusicoccum parvum UCRNP2]|uniref:Uncharacterized protein n=1 Tax=Botryosphaeria parva (strain UCR-NP2) TaxID=1287680 RepID=R1E9Y9_BOTPV|nr:hypothetical protein UCRNP2_9084 [Neofusicoccum parvum UCRNP2]
MDKSLSLRYQSSSLVSIFFSSIKNRHGIVLSGALVSILVTLITAVAPGVITKYGLGHYVDQYAHEASYGINVVAEPREAAFLLPIGNAQQTQKPVKKKSLTVPLLQFFPLLAFLAFLLGTLVLLLCYRFVRVESGFETFMDSQGAGVKCFMASIGILIRMFWSSVERDIRALEPWRRLARGNATAHESILVPSSAHPVIGIFSSTYRRHYFVAYIALLAILSEVLVVTLASVTFKGGLTYTGFNVSTFISSGIVSVMVLTVPVLMVRYRGGTLQAPGSLTATMGYFSADNNEVLRSFGGLSILCKKERDAEIVSLRRSYGLEKTGGRDYAALNISRVFVAHGGPGSSGQRIVPTSSPSNGTCEADCYLQIPFNKDWYWSKLFISTTLTAATEIVVINKKTNTTTTKTIFADLPDGFTLPPTNSAGSQAVFTTFGSLTTTLVYPTPYLSWDSGYSWSGTLPTVDKAGQSVCSTVVGQQQITTTRTDSTLVPVGTETWTTGGSTTTHTDRSWSPYATTTFATTTGVFAVVPYGDTFQLPVPPADPDDPNGFLYTLTYEATKLWPKSIETDGAYLSCSTASYPAPAVPMSTALFLTETSTSIEDDDDGPTTDEPPKTSSPPDETDSPVPPPPATTEPAPAETSPAPPAPTAGPPASNTAVPQVTANPGTGETVGTVIPPPAPTNEATSNPPDSNGNQPSTFQTVNVPTTIDGSATSAPAVVIGTQTQAIAPTLVGTQVDGTATSIPAVIIGSQTVAAGQTATFDSVPVVISAPSASDSPIQVVPAAPPAPATAATEAGAAAATLPNGATVLINTASAVVVGGQTLQPGANTVAAGPGGSSVAVILTTDAAGSSVVVADGSTAPLPQAPPTTGVVVLPGGATASVNSASQVVVGGQTLQPGANTVAVGPGGSSVAVVLTTDAAGSSVIVADGSTAPLPQAPATAVGAVTLPGGATASVGAGGQVVVGGQTLSAGSNTLGSGSTVVLTTDGAGRSVVVEGGSTVALASAAAAAAAAATATKAVATLADGEVHVCEQDEEWFGDGGDGDVILGNGWSFFGHGIGECGSGGRKECKWLDGNCGGRGVGHVHGLRPLAALSAAGGSG